MARLEPVVTARPVLSGESSILKKRKARQRSRCLEPGEESRLLAAAGPHLQRVVIAALGTCCRLGEILSLQWSEVSLALRDVVCPAGLELTT